MDIKKKIFFNHILFLVTRHVHFLIRKDFGIKSGWKKRLKKKESIFSQFKYIMSIIKCGSAACDESCRYRYRSKSIKGPKMTWFLNIDWIKSQKNENKVFVYSKQNSIRKIVNRRLNCLDELILCTSISSTKLHTRATKSLHELKKKEYNE